MDPRSTDPWIHGSADHTTHITVADISSRQTTFKDLQAIKDSSTTRLLVKIRHPRKHEAVIASQTVQREYQHQAKYKEGQECSQRVEAARAAMDKMQPPVNDLRQLEGRRSELKGEVKALLNKVFDGHTPNYPEEDGAENAMIAARQHLEEVSLPGDNAVPR